MKLIFDEGKTLAMSRVSQHDGSSRLIKAFFLLTLGVGCMLLIPESRGQSISPTETPQLVVQAGHKGGVGGVKFTPNGHFLVSLGADGKIKLWDTASGQFLYDIEDVKAFSSFAIDPRADVIATSQPKGTYFEINRPATVIKLWDLKTQKIIREFEGVGLPISFSPDGKTIATGAIDIAIFDVEDGKQRVSIHRSVGLTTRITFNSTGDVLISGSNIGEIDFWRAADGKLIDTFRDSRERIGGFSLSPGSKYLFYGTDSRMVMQKMNSKEIIWTKELERTVYPNNSVEINYISDVAFSSNGQYVATGHRDGTIHIFDSKNGEQIHSIKIANDVVTTIDFAPRGMILASGSGQTVYHAGTPNVPSIKFLDASTGKIARDLGGFQPSVASIALSPDGKSIYASENDFGNAQGHGRLDIWSLESGSELSRLESDKDVITNVVISPDGKKLATSGYGRRTKIWDLESQTTTFEFGGTLSAAFSPKSDSISVALEGRVGDPRTAQNPDIEVRDLKTGAIIQHINSNGFPLASLIYSRDGEHLIGSSSSTVKIWNVKSATQEKELTSPGSEFFAVATSPDGRILASGGHPGVDSYFKGIVQLWDTKTWEASPPMVDDSGWIRAVAFNSKGTVVASGGDGKKLILWDPRTGKRIQAFDDAGVQTIAFIKNDKYLIAGGSSGIRIFKNKSMVAPNSPGTDMYLEFCHLLSLNDGAWVTTAPDGRFDTNSLEEIGGLHWIMADDSMRPLPLEIFMRDYYEPRLLSRLINCDERSSCASEFGQLPPLAELNRTQPRIEQITVLPRAGTSDLIDVKVKVSSAPGRCRRGTEFVPCESGVYDLRLYRDGQMVGEFPKRESTRSSNNLDEETRATWLKEWRTEAVVKTARVEKSAVPVSLSTGPQELLFTGIRLPKRMEVSQVAFTAYAFNEDRVKGPTSEAVSYQIPASRPASEYRRAFIVTVGVDATSAPNWRLLFAPNSAREIGRFVSENLKASYEIVPVQLISEYEENGIELKQDLATKRNLRAVLNILSGKTITPELRQELPPSIRALTPATPDDLVFLYVASHGYADPKGGFYIVPSDIGDASSDVSETLLNRCFTSNENSEDCQNGRSFLERSISGVELTEWLEAVDAGEITLILDSCHSGAVSGPNFKPGPLGDRTFGQLSYDKGMLVLTATQAENFAWGTLALSDRSLLSYALTDQAIRKLKDEMEDWLNRAKTAVPELYGRNLKEEISGRPQEPVFFNFRKHRRMQ